MANFDTDTKIIVGSADATQDSSTASLAKDVNDYLQGIVNTKTIRTITTAEVTPGKIAVVIITDS